MLACAFVPDAKARADVLHLFAFLETLRAIPARVTEPLMGEIRLRWWWEAIEEIDQGRPVRYHPLTEAIKPLIVERGLPPRAFYDLIEGQTGLLEKGPLSLKDALDVVDRGEVIVARLAAQLIAPGADAAALIHAARLYGLADLKARHGVDDAGDAVFLVARGHQVGLPFDFILRVAHRHAESGRPDHRQIVQAVAHRHDLGHLQAKQGDDLLQTARFMYPFRIQFDIKRMRVGNFERAPRLQFLAYGGKQRHILIVKAEFQPCQLVDRPGASCVGVVPRAEELQEDPLRPSVVGTSVVATTRRGSCPRPSRLSWRDMFAMFASVVARGCWPVSTANCSAGRPKAS